MVAKNEAKMAKNGTSTLYFALATVGLVVFTLNIRVYLY